MAEQKITIPEGYELQKVNDFEFRIIKKTKELPNSWEEFCKNYPLKEGETWIDGFGEIYEVKFSVEKSRTDKWNNLLPNKEYAEAIISLIQLIQLRDCYRQGWKPDWTNMFKTEIKESITFKNNNLQRISFSEIHQIFSFQSNEIADKFYCNFKDLMEKIKPLFE